MQEPDGMNRVTRLDSRTGRARGPVREPNSAAGAGGVQIVVNAPTARRFCGVEEFARICGISRSHTYELVARREIPTLRLGRRVLIPLSFLDDLDGGRHDESA
jgi:excisionase family DNA binding protein